VGFTPPVTARRRNDFFTHRGGLQYNCAMHPLSTQAIQLCTAEACGPSNILSTKLITKLLHACNTLCTKTHGPDNAGLQVICCKCNRTKLHYTAMLSVQYNRQAPRPTTMLHNITFPYNPSHTIPYTYIHPYIIPYTYKTCDFYTCKLHAPTLNISLSIQAFWASTCAPPLHFYKLHLQLQ
jgi:hypothetical protein